MAPYPRGATLPHILGRWLALATMGQGGRSTASDRLREHTSASTDNLDASTPGCSWSAAHSQVPVSGGGDPAAAL
jgi:hypothetical protein